MKYVGALDQGTTSTRFIVFDQEGSLVSSHQLEHQQIYPQPGWVEHDPWEIWDNSSECISKALKAANLKGSDIAGIGITNQRRRFLHGTRKPEKYGTMQSSGRTCGEPISLNG